MLDEKKRIYSDFNLRIQQVSKQNMEKYVYKTVDFKLIFKKIKIER